MAERRVLNLDEVFGESRPIRVVWQGKSYDLRRPEAMSPRDLAQLEKLQGRVRDMQGGDDLSEEQAQALEEATQAALTMIGPELAPLGLPYLAAVRILLFYSQEVAPAANGGSDAPKATGEMPSPG